MNLWLFILLIFTGVVPLASCHSYSYYLIQQTKTWANARAYCRDMYTDLAIIESAADLLQLQTEALNNHFNFSAWVGLYLDVNSWHCSDGLEPLGSVVFWSYGQPNNNYGNQECGTVITSGWDDRACVEKHHFICFDAGKTGNDRFIHYAVRKNWSESQSYCRQYHTDLASPKESTEESYLVSLITGYTWIGLFRNTWKWVDNTNLSTTSTMWMSGQPDNDYSNENCGYITYSKYQDGKCSDLKAFFCHKLLMKRQTIRLKIESDQDVNVPAVIDALLEKLQLKLREFGITMGLTMTFVKQPVKANPGLVPPAAMLSVPNRMMSVAIKNQM